MASNFITTLTLMLEESVSSGKASNTEQTRGMVTSLWFIHECIGGYAGSAAGGWSYDIIGFKVSIFRERIMREQ